MLKWAAVLIGLCLLAAPAHAVVFWDDGFESGNTGYALASGMTYTTSIVHSGSRALDEFFCNPDLSQCGGFTDRTFQFTEELYTRWYMYIDPAFQVSEVATKLMFQGDNGTYPSFWWDMNYGEADLDVTAQGVVINGSLDSPNYFGGAIPRGQWVCIQTRIKMSTPGVLDGIIQAWINGTQVINVTNARLREANNSFPPNSPTAGFTFNRLYVQLGYGHIYYDDIAVGNTSIPCLGGGGGGDTTPPAAPTGLYISER